MEGSSTTIRKDAEVVRYNPGPPKEVGKPTADSFSEPCVTAGFYIGSTCSAVAINIVDYAARWPTFIKAGIFIAATAGGMYLLGKYGYAVLFFFLGAAGVIVSHHVLWSG